LARITRKELKHDELAQEVSRTYDFLQTNRDRLILWIAVAGIVLLGAGGGYLLWEKRTAGANEALARAQRTYHAPVEPPSISSSPSGAKTITLDFSKPASFPTEKEKSTAALKEFLAVAQKYSWLKLGKIARYYAGLCQADLGNFGEAEKELNAAIQSEDSDVSPLARLALANTLTREGKKSEAEKLYRYLVEHPSPGVPVMTAQLALADYLRASKPAEAEKIYRQLDSQKLSPTASGLAQKGLESLKK
jgi:predicted negative regulator of RcsB-dependent stress response